MHTFVVSPGLSNEDLLRQAEANPGWKVQRIDGCLVMSPPPGSRTGDREAHLTVLLAPFAAAGGYTLTGASGGYELPSGDVLEPDAALTAAERWRAAEAAAVNPEGYFALVPDIVAELGLSKRTRPSRPTGEVRALARCRSPLRRAPRSVRTNDRRLGNPTRELPGSRTGRPLTVTYPIRR
ncbi:MAG: Uma2 family endonuclease [Vulcanimicrobiaceae bacterium]